MKRNNYIIAAASCIVTISMGFSSCKGVEWDRKESLIGMSNLWAYSYVGCVIDRYDKYNVSPSDSSGNKHTMVTVNDTIAVESVFTGMIDGDSINVTTTVVMIDSVLTVTTEGYRIADNLTAHIFTVDPGIIDHNGKLHIDFYKTDGMIPWAWTEVSFLEEDHEKGYYTDSFKDTKLGWY